MDLSEHAEAVLANASDASSSSVAAAAGEEVEGFAHSMATSARWSLCFRRERHQRAFSLAKGSGRGLRMEAASV